LLRYGKNTNRTTKLSYKRSRLLFNKKTKRLAFYTRLKVKLTKLKTLYYLPTYWSKVILSNKRNNKYFLIYLYSDVYYFHILLMKPSSDWLLDLNTNTIVTKDYLEPSFKPFFMSSFKNLFQSFSYWFYTKLKIKGKGYYVYRNYRNTLTHQLGHSHRRYIYSYFVYMRFISKTTIYMAGLSKKDILLSGRLLQDSKYINIFTGRGVRFTKQLVYKKTGKVSTYR
jgi:ribosomal protein L6P/L9E